MAKKNTSVESNMARMPEEFRQVGSVGDAPWFKLQEGNKLIGILKGLFTRKDERAATGRSKFFQIETTESTLVTVGKGENAVIEEVGAGIVVNLNYGAKTKDLEDFIAPTLAGGQYKVFVQVGKKKPISGGRSFWDMLIGQKMIQAPMSSPADLDPEELGEEVET